MKVKISNYLIKEKDTLKKLVDILSKEYKYVSILGVDTVGKSYGVQKTGVNINDSMWCERGFVVRLHNGSNYSEYSFNNLDRNNLNRLVEEIKEKVKGDLEKINSSNVPISNYPVVNEEEIKKSFYGDVKILPKEVSSKEKIERMTKIKDKALKLSDSLIDFRVNYEEVHISKIFLSSKKELEQSYIWTQGALIPIVRRDDNTKFAYEGFAGLKGVELIYEMEEAYEEVINNGVKLLDAKKVEPGEYDIICAPDVAGLIAHEAFGHGVEMDMFVKNRAKAVEYLNKPVASNLVTMHDGARASENVSSYLFDDEGTLGSDTIIIENGILKRGISDLLSSLRLNTKATGNGKRQSFERKAYARMTSTFFAEGKDNLEDMIASVKKGYLLEGLMSGMEDPKNWGIQCMILQGKEIIDGKLTGNIVSPVIMTGYVPDLLKSISMVSEEVIIYGSGACGKGYKEFVKTADGGPYIKARGRLG